MKRIPLPKGTVFSDCNNYRPITLLCIAAKCVDYFVHKSLLKYMLNNGLIYGYQAGSLANHSTESILIKMYHDLCEVLEDSNSCSVMAYDYRKAFDIVPHKLR